MAVHTLQRHLAALGHGPLSAHELRAAAQDLADFAPDLVLVFGDKRHFQGAGTGQPSPVAWLHGELSRLVPGAIVAGCSTAGEIIGSTVHEGSLTLTAVRLECTALSVVSLALPAMEASESVGCAISGLLRDAPQGPPQQIWVLAPGVAINGSALVNGLKSGFEGTALPGISGGLAGDGGAFVQTYTIGPAGVRTDHVVAIGFNGDGLVSGSSAHGGWEPFGPARRVTRAQGNRLHEMDREPALAVYRRYLGEYAKDLPSSGLLFPLQITEGPDRGLIRTILGIDEEDGSLILAGDVAIDAQVRLMHASAHQLVAAAEQAAQRLGPGLEDSGQALALLVSCVGRRIVMGDMTEEEVEAVRGALPKGTCITGFYSNGEIAAWNFSGDCRLHNQTMTISWLCEHDSPDA